MPETQEHIEWLLYVLMLNYGTEVVFDAFKGAIHRLFEEQTIGSNKNKLSHVYAALEKLDIDSYLS